MSITRFFASYAERMSAKVLWKNCATHPGFGALCNSKKYFCSLLTFSAAHVFYRDQDFNHGIPGMEKSCRIHPYTAVPYTSHSQSTVTVNHTLQFTSEVPSSCSSLASSSSLVSPPGIKGKWWWAAGMAKTKTKTTSPASN